MMTHHFVMTSSLRIKNFKIEKVIFRVISIITVGQHSTRSLVNGEAKASTSV